MSGRVLRNHSLLLEGIDESGTVFKEKINITNEHEFVVPNLVGKPAPNAIVVNSNDHAYVEVLIDDKSLDFFFNLKHIKKISLINRGIL